MKMTLARLLNASLAIAASAGTATDARGGGAPDAAGVDFARDIRPMLEARCWKCHGPDKRKGGVRLTNRAEALQAGNSGDPALAPGDAKHSLLVKVVSSRDPDERMPPESEGAPLDARQIALLTRWIDEGAAWPADAAATRHWAYVRPVRPPLPAVKDAAWSRNPIDRFVLARLEQEGLAPAPPAAKELLLRRVYLDLVGLPPSPAEVDAFLADAAPDAYEKVVDRLLASPQYGERWARLWLDLARYADSNGFQADQIRRVWPYRDWVIDALNRDLPFDQFTIDQLAGDLVPHPTLAQRIATGFHRAAPCNVENGVDPEENRVNQVMDRVNTTATVWLATTFECAQCHNHKYDPFTQEEYYRLFAYFNNTPLEVKQVEGVSYEMVGPKMVLPSSLDEPRRRALEEARKKRDTLEAALKAAAPGPGQAQVAEALRSRRELRHAFREASARVEELGPTDTLVMVEMDRPRDTHVLKRGNFLDPGAPVRPGTPAALHRLPAGAPPNRLALARWLVDPANPLVGRVMVNRWWAELMGRGIVATPEDFGSHADPPSHPELLDWLAVEFVEGGWSQKRLIRLIVTSATYRQTSVVPPARLERDPENVLYARGPRVRLPAETIRDNALAVSGLLSRKQGGPPVYPPQPEGLWTQIGRGSDYKPSVGEDRHRRGVYVVWKRTNPYPSMVNFDAPDRTTCTVKRSRSNTPLQALTLLNDPAYVEMAMGLARRLLAEAPDASVAGRARYGFRLTLARQPSSAELRELTTLYEQTLRDLRRRPKAAAALVASTPEVKPPAGHDALDLGAWFAVANALLNLDETITKG